LQIFRIHFIYIYMMYVATSCYKIPAFSMALLRLEWYINILMEYSWSYGPAFDDDNWSGFLFTRFETEDIQPKGILIIRNNFTKWYWTITCFDGRILDYHFSQIGILNYQKLLKKGIPSALGVKSCQNPQNTPMFIFFNFFYKIFQRFRHMCFCKFC
jgi:hypothetical protein